MTADTIKELVVTAEQLIHREKVPAIDFAALLLQTTNGEKLRAGVSCIFTSIGSPVHTVLRQGEESTIRTASCW
jgi:hypothetical protein